MRHRRVAALLLLAACAPSAWGQSPGGAFRPYARVRYSSDANDGALEGRAYVSSTDIEVAQVNSVLNGLNSYAAGGFTSGPILYVGNYGTVESDIQVVDISGSSNQATDTNEENRLADDLNGNGNAGVLRVLADLDGDGVIEPGEIVGIVNNFGDLHTFNVSFDEVIVRTEREVTSFELMKQHVLFGDLGHNTSDTGWRFEMFQDAWSVGFGDEVAGVWGLDDPVLDSVRAPWLRESLRDTRFSLYSTAGLRSLLYDTDFFFEGRGSILGRTWVDQSVDHASVGPQVGLGAVVESSIFRFEALALGMAGYGRASYRQVGVFGEEAIPGALNRSSTARETYSNSALDEERLAWHGETRLTAGCQLTQNLRLDATWRWFATGPVQHAADATQWAAPDFGIQPDDDVAYSNDWFFGATYTR